MVNKVKNAKQAQSPCRDVEIPSEPQATSLEDLPGHRDSEEFYESPRSKVSNIEKNAESEVSPKVRIGLKIYTTPPNVHMYGCVKKDDKSTDV